MPRSWRRSTPPARLCCSPERGTSATDDRAQEEPMAPALTSEQLVAEYAEASARLDTDALAELRHPEWKVAWPQSGEEVHSSEAFAEIVRNYPGGAARSEITR